EVVTVVDPVGCGLVVVEVDVVVTDQPVGFEFLVVGEPVGFGVGIRVGGATGRCVQPVVVPLGHSGPAAVREGEPHGEFLGGETARNVVLVAAVEVGIDRVVDGVVLIARVDRVGRVVGGPVHRVLEIGGAFRVPGTVHVVGHDVAV